MPTQAEKAAAFQALHQRNRDRSSSPTHGTRARRGFSPGSASRPFNDERGACLCARAPRRHGERQPRRSIGQRESRLWRQRNLPVAADLENGYGLCS